MLEVTRALKAELGVSTFDPMSMRATTSDFSVVNATCPKAPTCYNSTYRTYDGSCNNLAAPLLGMSNTVYRRLLPANYSDGVQIPRLAWNGSQLNSPRQISMAVFTGADRLVNYTLAVMQFGQFINHDMELTNQFTYPNGTGILCCNNTIGTLPASLTNPACMAISVPLNDPFYAPRNISRTCMNFVRTVAGLRNNCSLGYADQLNQNTHWLDASTVYGSNNQTAASLRANVSGLLLSSNLTGRQLLPISSPCSSNTCFYAGDSRVNEQPQLTVMHTLWMREHNRIAKALAAINPTWSDEVLFQEVRRIVVAEIQHITYTEWLPTILNSTYLTNYGLLSSAPNFFTGYQSSQTDGPISNEFATAAFRMGHSMVQGFIQLFAANGSLSSNSYNMSAFFNNPSQIVTTSTFLDSAIRGLLMQPMEAVDRQVNGDLLNLLFSDGLKYGFDIVSLNMQRGRDHGLPSYNFYRQLCGLPKMTSFNDSLLNSAGNSLSAVMSQVYSSVNDIDLYVGGLLEFAVNGGNVGPTFSCIIAENFAQLKKSDRFFYENGGQSNSFTSAQLTEIRKASMARIFCDNSDGTVTTIQPRAFFFNNATNNAPVLCNSTTIPALNLTQWKKVI